MFAVVTAMAAMLAASPAPADVFAVPQAIRQLRAPKEELRVLRSPTGVVLGEERFRAVVTGDRLAFAITTSFTSGEDWDEHGEMDLAAGFRARLFQKTVRRGGHIAEERHFSD